MLRNSDIIKFRMERDSMRKIYNKLVRDRIPAIIQSECRDCQTRRLTSAEYQTELKAKLVEEAREVQEASDREALIEELADLSEVLDAMMDFFEIDATEIQAVKDAKAQTRGRFKDRIFLEFTEDEDEPSA
ncbi:nucleotide pyrophosphohydrolase [Holdemania filiformis]|uniref:Nucleotide pyrophosphohydrolase n=2 Tax=Holdemania filiformis TaxID=61171 RepID=A0A412G3E4_9FIRM|nr:nucleotide pyrophosphohydrolase [Holdemania filiformis]